MYDILPVEATRLLQKNFRRANILTGHKAVKNDLVKKQVHICLNKQLKNINQFYLSKFKENYFIPQKNVITNMFLYTKITTPRVTFCFRKNKKP